MVFIIVHHGVTVSCLGMCGEAFWWSLESSLMFTAKTRKKWSFLHFGDECSAAEKVDCSLRPFKLLTFDQILWLLHPVRKKWDPYTFKKDMMMVKFARFLHCIKFWAHQRGLKLCSNSSLIANHGKTGFWCEGIFIIIWFIPACTTN